MLGELMEKEIGEQPAALLRKSRTYYKQLSEALRGTRPDMIVLAARGTSDNAALIARYWLEIYAGIPVSLAAPSVFTRFNGRPKYRNCLCIGISQSGAAPDVAEVLSIMREDGHPTLAITNTEFSRLSREADHTLLLDVGVEKSVAATKTYTASLLALYQAVRCFTPILPSPEDFLPREDWLSRTRLAVDKVSGTVVRSQPVFALGRGFSFGTAHECALKLMECALVPCKAYSSADFEHGPRALAGSGTAAISFTGPMPDLANQGCQIICSPDVPDNVPAPLRPIWDAPYFQYLALSVARARGLDPDGPQHLSKVTETL
ncbi:SIS domain-containing protein [soil metagenome]